MRNKITVLLLLVCASVFCQENQFKVYFDFDEFQINYLSAEKLNTWISGNPEIIVSKIYGYCDAIGSNEYNDYMSVQRAKFVQKLLTENNISLQEHAEIRGFGKNFEQALNRDENRNVTIFYTAKVSEIKKQEVAESKLAVEIKNSNVGEKLKLKNLNFYNQSGRVVPSSIPILKELLQIMIDNPKLKIEIQGHICCQTNSNIHETAKLRAQAVYYFLIDNAIDEKRLSYRSFGSSRPLYPIPEKSEFEKDENRRVEILILANE